MFNGVWSGFLVNKIAFVMRHSSNLCGNLREKCPCYKYPAINMFRNGFVAASVAQSKNKYYFSRGLRLHCRSFFMHCLGVLFKRCFVQLASQRRGNIAKKLHETLPGKTARDSRRYFSTISYVSTGWRKFTWLAPINICNSVAKIAGQHSSECRKYNWR